LLQSDEKRLNVGILRARRGRRYQNVIAASERFARRDFA
jgi:hypothetical protein